MSSGRRKARIRRSSVGAIRVSDDEGPSRVMKATKIKVFNAASVARTFTITVGSITLSNLSVEAEKPHIIKLGRLNYLLGGDLIGKRGPRQITVYFNDGEKLESTLDGIPCPPVILEAMVPPHGPWRFSLSSALRSAALAIVSIIHGG